MMPKYDVLAIRLKWTGSIISNSSGFSFSPCNTSGGRNFISKTGRYSILCKIDEPKDELFHLLKWKNFFNCLSALLDVGFPVG